MKNLILGIVVFILIDCHEIPKRSNFNISLGDLREYVNKYGESAVIDSFMQNSITDTLDMMNFWYSSTFFDSIWYLRDTKIEIRYASLNLMEIFCVYSICKENYYILKDTGIYVMKNSENNEILYDFYFDNINQKYRNDHVTEIDSIYDYYTNWKSIYLSKGLDYIRENHIMPIESKYIFDLIEKKSPD